jgi:hypothetical protein
VRFLSFQIASPRTKLASHAWRKSAVSRGLTLRPESPSKCLHGKPKRVRRSPSCVFGPQSLAASERKSDTGVDQLSRGSFSAVGSSARDIDMHWVATLFLIRTLCGASTGLAATHAGQ